MPATATGHGAQVVLDGDAQAAARGVYAPSLRGNSERMAGLVSAGVVPDGSTADGSTVGGNLSKRRVPVASLMRTWSPASQNWATVTASIFTLASQWELEADFDLIRFVYSNNANNTFAIVLAKFAPTSQVGDGHSPVNAAGSTDFTLFQSAFFNNAGLDVAPQDQTTWGSGTATFTIPANAGSLLTPTKWFSDWMRVRPLARTDGTLPLLCVRHLTDAAATYRCVGQLNWATFMAAAGARRLNVVHKAGADNVTTPSAIASPSVSTFLTPDAIQYMSAVPGYSVLSIGDSLTKGYGSASLIQSWGYMACAGISTPGRPVSFYNQGWQGQTSQDFWTNGYLAFKASKPNIVTIPVYSPNDGITQATADAGWSRACDFADYVARNRAVPVLMGPLPWGGISTGAAEAARLSTRTRMLNASQYGQWVLDWEGVMGTGASPNRIPAGLLAGDALHPNDAGNSLMDAQVFRPTLQAILASVV